MAIIAIDNLEAGMILKSSISDRSGRLLLPAGAELEDKHLKIFRTWGVSEADIAGENGDGDNGGATVGLAGDPSSIAEAKLEIESLFIHNDPQHQFIKELMRICTSRKVANAA